MRLAVGITTMSARSPPEVCTKRSRICWSFSLFSAPPIAMIQPRVPPSGILLGTMLLLLWLLWPLLPMSQRLVSSFEGAAPHRDAALYVHCAPDDNAVHGPAGLQCHQVRIRPDADLALAAQTQEPGRVAGEGQQGLCEGHAARQQFAQGAQQRSGGAHIKAAHPAIAVKAGQAPTGIGAHRDALGWCAAGRVAQHGLGCAVSVLSFGH